MEDVFEAQKPKKSKKTQLVADPSLEKVLLSDFQNTDSTESQAQFKSLTVDTTNLKSFHSTPVSNEQMFSLKGAMGSKGGKSARNYGISPNEFLRPPVKRRLNGGAVPWGMTESMHQTLVSGGVYATDGCVPADQWTLHDA